MVLPCHSIIDSQIDQSQQGGIGLLTFCGPTVVCDRLAITKRSTGRKIATGNAVLSIPYHTVVVNGAVVCWPKLHTPPLRSARSWPSHPVALFGALSSWGYCLMILC